MNSLHRSRRFLFSLLPLLLVTLAEGNCSLNGTWYYVPEGPTHDYTWSMSAAGTLECFEGRDSWKRASGQLVANNLTLIFGDPARCPGATGKAHMGIVKWGLVDAGCNTVVMHDTQPNCPRQGLCKYMRCPTGICPPAPPPPPSPCPASTTDPLDVKWLSCRARQIIQGCKEPIQANSPLNKGITLPPSLFFPIILVTILPIKSIAGFLTQP